MHIKSLRSSPCSLRLRNNAAPKSFLCSRLGLRVALRGGSYSVHANDRKCHRVLKLCLLIFGQQKISAGGSRERHSQTTETKRRITQQKKKKVFFHFFSFHYCGGKTRHLVCIRQALYVMVLYKLWQYCVMFVLSKGHDLKTRESSLQNCPLHFRLWFHKQEKL